MPDPALLKARRLAATVGLLTLLLAAGGALAVVALRQAEFHLAQTVSDRQRDLTLLTRQLRTLETAVAAEQQPEFLLAHVPEGLRPMQAEQIRWVRAAAPAAPAAPTRELSALPQISLQLAALEPGPAPNAAP